MPLAVSISRLSPSRSTAACLNISFAFGTWSDGRVTTQARFPWVFQMIANQAEGDRKLAVSDAFPELAPEACTAKLQEVQKWLKSLPFASRPLVKVSCTGFFTHSPSHTCFR